MEIKPIGFIKNAFPTKFGLPRQGGICKSITATLVFEPEYRIAEALRGLEEYSHVWVIWGFSENEGKKFSPTVRPPRLGGNTRMGVFATRSSFRPNSLALSCLQLDGIEKTEKYGHVLHLSGADMMDGTPVYDIKPYLPHIDSIPNAKGGFSTEIEDYTKDVSIPGELLEKLPPHLIPCLKEALAQDPRPSYIEDAERIYGFAFDSFEVKFKVQGKILTVVSIEGYTKHEMTLHHEPFSAIKEGWKTVEMRLCDEKRMMLKIGDTIEFTDRETKEKMLTRVVNLEKFKDFYELYASYGKVEIGYRENETAHPDDMSQYYSKEDIDRFGALAITIELL